MADSYKDILITPNRSNTADPKVEFRGGNSSVNTSISLFTYPTSNGTLSFEGSAGQLFSITNDLSGSIFSVNDISGIPSIEVFANGNVSLAQYNGNVGIGTNSPGAKLQIQADGIGLRLDGTPDTTRTIFLRNTTVTNPAQIYSDGSLRLYTEDAGTDIRFHTVSNGTTNERMRIAANGNVGIGTTSPGKKLDVNGEINLTTGLTITPVESALYSLDGALSYYSNTNGVYLNGAGPSGWLRLNGSGAENYRNCIDIYGSGADIIQFRVANTNAMRLNSTGLGIGTTSPAAALDVNGKAIFRVSDDSASSGGFTITNDGTQPTVQSWGFNSNPVFLVTSETVAAPHIAAHQVSTDTNGAVIRGYKGRGTSTGNASVANGDEILRIDAWPLHTAGPNIYKFGGGMIWYKDDNGGTASTYAPVSLRWIMSNSITTTIEAMTLLYNGNLTIAGTLTQSSSAALKENINPISNALDLIANLTGVTYNRKDGSAINCPGFIAEEVDKVLPNVVQKDKEGNPSGIQYTNLIAYLVESIKELKAEIDILKGR